MASKRRNNFLRSVPFGRFEAAPSLREVGSADRAAYWRGSCFYASPIGTSDSKERKHAEMFQRSLVEPAIEALDPEMTVVRADELATSSITGSVIEHVRKSRLLIADLSFQNPNVMYEVGVRDECEMPFILISRSADPIPSNLKDYRVVLINSDDTPAFVSEMSKRKREITEYARSALFPPETL